VVEWTSFCICVLINRAYIVLWKRTIACGSLDYGVFVLRGFFEGVADVRALACSQVDWKDAGFVLDTLPFNGNTTRCRIGWTTDGYATHGTPTVPNSQWIPNVRGDPHPVILCPSNVCVVIYEIKYSRRSPNIRIFCTE
jgi:hypothetical protein